MALGGWAYTLSASFDNADNATVATEESAKESASVTSIIVFGVHGLTSAMDQWYERSGQRLG